MQDLDAVQMGAFTRAISQNGRDATQVSAPPGHGLSPFVTWHRSLQKTGIDHIIPGAIIDDFLFEPCGYSMNAILPNVSSKTASRPLAAVDARLLLSGLLLHHPHHAWTGLLLRQLWDQRGAGGWPVHFTFALGVHFAFFLHLQDSYRGLIAKVLDIFKPGKFLMTLFANSVSDLPWSYISTLKILAALTPCSVRCSKS